MHKRNHASRASCVRLTQSANVPGCSWLAMTNSCFCIENTKGNLLPEHELINKGLDYTNKIITRYSIKKQYGIKPTYHLHYLLLGNT